LDLTDGVSSCLLPLLRHTYIDDMRRVLFALLVLAAASGAACDTPPLPPPPLWRAWRAGDDAAVAAVAVTAAVAEFAPSLTTMSVEDSPGLLDAPASTVTVAPTAGYRQSLMSALSGCVADVAKLRLDAGAFEASCMGVGFFFPKAVRSLGTPF
jgi:hypothetical protein